MGQVNRRYKHCRHCSAPAATTGVAIAGRLGAESQLLPLRAVDNRGEGDMKWIVQALAYAGQQSAAVAVAAVGTWPGQIDAEKAADYNQSSLTFSVPILDTLFVVPSGNESSDNDVLPV